MARVISLIGYIEVGDPKQPKRMQELELDVEASFYHAERHEESQVVIEGVWLRDTKHAVDDLVTYADRERWREEILEHVAEDMERERYEYEEQRGRDREE